MRELDLSMPQKKPESGLRSFDFTGGPPPKTSGLPYLEAPTPEKTQAANPLIPNEPNQVAQLIREYQQAERSLRPDSLVQGKEPSFLDRVLRSATKPSKEEITNAIGIAEGLAKDRQWKQQQAGLVGQNIAGKDVGFLKTPDIGQKGPAGVAPGDYSTALKNYGKLTQKLGLRDQPTTDQLTSDFMNSVAVAVAAATGDVSLPIFLGLRELENYVVSKKNNEPWIFGAGKGLKDLPAEKVNGATGFMLDMVDFIWQLVATHGITTGGASLAKNLANKVLRNVVKTYDAPKTLTIPAEKLEEAFVKREQGPINFTGEDIRSEFRKQFGREPYQDKSGGWFIRVNNDMPPVKLDPERDIPIERWKKLEAKASKELSGTINKWREKYKDGMQVDVPYSEVVKVVDKPWWGNLKKVIRGKPYEKVISRKPLNALLETTGKVPKELPSGQGFTYYDVPPMDVFSPELAKRLQQEGLMLPQGQGFELRGDAADALSQYSPELAKALQKLNRNALPPGQGFELKPKTILRKSPVYPGGQTYVAGKQQEPIIEYKDILPKSGKPYQSLGAAKMALRNRKDISDGYQPTKVSGGWVLRKSAEATQKPEQGGPAKPEPKQKPEAKPAAAEEVARPAEEQSAPGTPEPPPSPTPREKMQAAAKEAKAKTEAARKENLRRMREAAEKQKAESPAIKMEMAAQKAKAEKKVPNQLTGLIEQQSQNPLIGEETGQVKRDGISILTHKSSMGASRRYVYTKDGEIVSGLQVMVKPDGEALITNAYTKPSMQRRGLATQLFKKAQQDYPGAGIINDRSKAGQALVAKATKAQEENLARARKPEATEQNVKVKKEGSETVVSADLTKKQENALKPREQKKYLMAEIDKAIENAPFEYPEHFGPSDSREKMAEVRKNNLEKFGTVTIEVPGDGEFNILNNKISLQEFKKNAKSFPIGVPKPTPIRRASSRATGKRITGEVDYYNPYVPQKNLIEEKRKWVPFQYYTKDGWFTQGSYAVKLDKKPKTKQPVQIEGYPDIAAIIPKKTEPAKILGVLNQGISNGKDTIPTVHIRNEFGTEAFLDADFVDVIFTHYPKAKPFIEGHKEGISGYPVVFEEGGKVVGVIMPMKNVEPEGRLKERADIARGEKPAKKKPLGVKEPKYVYHRGSNPRTAKHVVLASDDLDTITQYGGKGYAIPTSSLIDVPQWVQNFAEDHYKQEYGDDYEHFLKPNANPDNIVNSADIWDDPSFVDDLWTKHEDRLLDLRDKGIVGFKTTDGAVIFPGEDIPLREIKSEGQYPKPLDRSGKKRNTITNKGVPDREGEKGYEEKLRKDALTDLKKAVSGDIRTATGKVEWFGRVSKKGKPGAVKSPERRHLEGAGTRRRGTTGPLEVETKGRIDFRGQVIDSPAKLAEIGQVHRDPRFETFRVYALKNKKIIATDAISSRKAGFTGALLPGGQHKRIYELDRWLDRLGADAFFVSHNHPSRYPEPSKDDLKTTKALASRIKMGNGRYIDLGKRFKGHVIIDSGEYAFIAPDGSVTMERVPGLPDDWVDPFAVVSKESEAIGKPINNSGDIAIACSQLKIPENYISVVVTNMQDGKVEHVYDMSAKLLTAEKPDGSLAAADWTRGLSKETGSTRMFVWLPEAPTTERYGRGYKAKFKKLVREAVFTDIAWNNDVTGWTEFINLTGHMASPKYHMGRLSSKITAKRVAEKIGDYGEYLAKSERGAVDIEGLAKSGDTDRTRKAIEQMREDFLTPVPGSALDAAAIAYLKTEKLSDYLDAMPDMGEINPKELFRYDPKAKKYIAQYLTKGGNLKPALRKSGFYAIKTFDDAFSGENIKDIGKLIPQTSDPARMIEAIDQGYFGGMAQKYIRWPTLMNSLAKIRWSDNQKVKLASVVDKYNIYGNKKANVIGDIIESISGNNAWKWEVDKVLDLPKVKTYLSQFKLKERKQMVKAAMALRKMFHNLRDNQNHARKTRKQELIPYRVFYRPWIRDTNLWSRLAGLKQRPKEIMEKPEMPDFIFPNRPFNPRAEARTGLLANYPKERNIIKLMSGYIETASKDIFDTNTIHNNKVYSAVLRGRGLVNAAAGVDEWTAEVYAGVKPWLSKGIAKTLPVPIRSGMQKVRRGLTRAVFPLNWKWNLFIQTSSAALTYARYGEKNSLLGLKYFSDRAMRQGTKQNAYSSILKSRWGGQAAYQDLQGSILKNKHLDANVWTKAENLANGLTSAMEDALTGHAIVAAYYHGKKLGLKGRALWEYASEGGAKTQSMYNFADLPGILRNREAGQFFPFQTFAFDVFNTIREMNLPVLNKVVGKTGAYETIAANSAEGKGLLSNRLKMLARWMAAIVVTNAVVEKATGRKPWQITSFVPFLRLMDEGYRGRLLPVAYYNDFKHGLESLFKYGSLKRLRTWFFRYHVPGGIQLNRTISGIEAAIKGEVENARGRRMYRVKGTAEKIRAITMGPSGTKAGREYYDKRKPGAKKHHRRGRHTGNWGVADLMRRAAGNAGL